MWYSTWAIDGAATPRAIARAIKVGPPTRNSQPAYSVVEAGTSSRRMRAVQHGDDDDEPRDQCGTEDVLGRHVTSESRIDHAPSNMVGRKGPAK